VKTRVAVLERFGEPLAVQELELDDPKGHEVLVRLVACGVCHTDLYTASGADRPATRRPCSATRAPASWSRSAPMRRSPKTNLCLAIREQQNTRLSRDGERLRHFMGTSTFAEYTVIPEIALARVSPDAPLEGAALFACGLSTRPRAGAAAGRPLDRRGDRRAAVPLATSSRSTTSTAASSCSRPRTASAP
jgi:S-(hydroxymethyl)glutathione dehydrogenase / alcohol dehydrogenase